MTDINYTGQVVGDEEGTYFYLKFRAEGSGESIYIGEWDSLEEAIEALKAWDKMDDESKAYFLSHPESISGTTRV